jgi:hypothetical protein
MMADMKSNKPTKPARSDDYYVSHCVAVEEGAERPLDRLKRRIQEARDRAQAERAAQVNTTKSK